MTETECSTVSERAQCTIYLKPLIIWGKNEDLIVFSRSYRLNQIYNI